MPSEKFAPDKLHDIIDFRKEYKEQQQTPSSGTESRLFGKRQEIARWLIPNTESIRIHCKSAIDLVIPCVSPFKTSRKGNTRNMTTGMKMMNAPYQAR